MPVAEVSEEIPEVKDELFSDMPVAEVYEEIPEV
jgi:hypothetical protein